MDLDFESQLFQENSNCIYEVENSVSFGRYMSENLAWERWSSFNNNRNRYVEEAEKYSRPGSVAQKKAYFEAHFKRMAALKAAALLEQEASAESGNGTGTVVGVNDDDDADDNAKDSGVNVQVFQAHDGDEGGNDMGVEGFVVHQNELYSVVVAENDELLSGINEDVEVVESKMNDTDKVVDQSEIFKDENWNENCQKFCGNGIAQIDKPPLQKANLEREVSAPVVKKNPPLSSFMLPIDGVGKGTPVRSTGKENYATIVTPMKNKSSIVDPDKKRTPLRASINREFSRILSPVIRKIGNSSKTSKDCSTPLKTPAKGFVNGVPEPTPMTPDSTKRGDRSHHDLSAGQRKPAGPRWHILSEGFKSPGANRNKTMSPIIPTSFCLRGGEKASRRKQKLEDKFNATTTEKAPQPSKFKEKAEAELNKIRQSFCFKVMSSPDHYTEAEFHNKNESRHHESPKRAERQLKNTSRSSLPPRRPTVNASSLKNVNQRSCYPSLYENAYAASSIRN